jgi:hypothetical protein
MAARTDERLDAVFRYAANRRSNGGGRTRSAQRSTTSSHRLQEAALPKGNLNRSTQPVSVCT